MVQVPVALLISGGRRLRHLRYLDGDPMILRLSRLTRLPTPRTFGRWLRALRARHLPRLHLWLGLKARIQQTRVWMRMAASVSCAEHQVAVAPWARQLRLVIYRTRVQDETAKNFQLDLFDPKDGHNEYAAVTTNKTLGGPALWAFMCHLDVGPAPAVVERFKRLDRLLAA